MKFRNLTPFCTCALLVGLSLAAGVFSARAQTSPLLEITEFTNPPGELLQVWFSDAGTGATNYVLEGSSHLGDTAVWAKVPGSLILDLGEGNHQVIAPSPAGAFGFYRILAEGGLSGPVTATFATGDLRIVEGSVAAPVVYFNAPYFGTLRYTLTGATGTGEAISESGEVTASGTSVSIPLDLLDDDVVGTLTFLTLTLQGMPGVIPGSIQQTQITIDENDALWQGSLSLDGAELGFSLLIEEVDSVKSARLQGDGLGFFGDADVPASLTFSASVFDATAQVIQIPPEDSYLNAATEIYLSLRAETGMENQQVSGQQVEGIGTLISRVVGQPHLDRTNQSPFILLKPPVSPSTNQVTLMANPSL